MGTAMLSSGKTWVNYREAKAREKSEEVIKDQCEGIAVGKNELR